MNASMPLYKQCIPQQKTKNKNSIDIVSENGVQLRNPAPEQYLYTVT